MASAARRGLTITGALLGGAVFLWLVYRGLTWDLRQSDADPAATFTSTQVVRGDLRETVAATGTMESVTRVDIKSEVSGVVRQLHVEEGDRVRTEPEAKDDGRGLSA